MVNGLTGSLSQRVTSLHLAGLQLLINATRVPMNLLNNLTLKHHELFDQVSTRLTSQSLLFPHGFFEDGWGNKSLRARFEREMDEYGQHLPVATKIEPKLTMHQTDANHSVSILRGYFPSPLEDLRQVLPESSQMAAFEMIQPRQSINRGPAVGILRS